MMTNGMIGPAYISRASGYYVPKMSRDGYGIIPLAWGIAAGASALAAWAIAENANDVEGEEHVEALADQKAQSDSDYLTRFQAQEEGYLTEAAALGEQARQAEVDAGMVRQQLRTQVGITKYTDEERATLGITGDDIADLYDTERQQTLQDINNRLSTIQGELGGGEVDDSKPFPWVMLAAGGLGLLLVTKLVLK